MTSETREVGRFIAVDDNGVQYTLVVYQDFIQSRVSEGTFSETPGPPWVCTADGEHANRLSRGEYELITSGLRLHSSDPRAI